LKIHNSKCHPQAESSPSANPIAPSLPAVFLDLIDFLVDTSDQFIDMLEMIVMKIVMKILKNTHTDVKSGQIFKKSQYLLHFDFDSKILAHFHLNTSLKIRSESRHIVKFHQQTILVKKLMACKQKIHTLRKIPKG
jgi:hypothetical protein